jgi:DNA-binding NarL/FixJ family response regulator
MAEPLRYPERIEWEAEAPEHRDPGYDAVLCAKAVWVDQPSVRAVIQAYERSFSAELGALILNGPADSVDEAKRCAEAAFRALVDLKNTLSQPPAPDPLERLSPRERDVVEGLRRGVRLIPLAKELGIRPFTIRNHLKHAFRKLGVRSQVELLALIGGTRG